MPDMNRNTITSLLAGEPQSIYTLACAHLAADEHHPEFAATVLQIHALAHHCGFAMDRDAAIGISPDMAINRMAGAIVHPTEGTRPHRVLKDTIIQRLKGKEKLESLAYLIQSLPTTAQFEFLHSTWFSSESPEIVGAVQALSEDPHEILAFDPLA